MSTRAGKRRAAAWVALATLAALAGCAGMKSGDPLATPVYRCDKGMQFSVAFANDAAVLKGARGDDVLLRDAGGQGAQTVYSNPRMRAEFGLGAGGREAVLRYLQQPVVARCASD